MRNINIEEEISKKEAEIAKLKEELRQFNSLTPEKRLAIALHAKFCRWNHVDGCGWEYENEHDPKVWTKDGPRRTYLVKATNFLNLLDGDDGLAYKLIDAL